MTAPNAVGPRGPMELAALAEIDEETRNGFAPGAAHRAILQQMVSASKFPEAVKFVAFSLPRREGVWWAWVVAKRAAGDAPSPKVKASLEATERWISQPTDANRRTAFELAEKAELGTPAGCAGAAAFFAGESLAPADVKQAVPPGPWDCNKMIANAVILSAIATEPEKAPEKFMQALQQGLDVIGKIKAWPGGESAPLEAPAPPPPASAPPRKVAQKPASTLKQE